MGANVHFFSKNRQLFDPDYQSILDHADSNIIPKPSMSQQIIQNQLVLDLKANGIWDKLDLFYLYANDSGLDYSSINWITPNAFGLGGLIGGVHTINSNLDQDQISTVNTGFTPLTDGVNYQLNSCSFGYKVFTASNITVGDSVMQTLSGSKMHLDDSTFNCDAYVNNSTKISFGNAHRSISRRNGSMISVVKENITTNKLYENGVLQSTKTQASLSLPATDVIFFVGSHDTKLTMQYLGGALTSTELVNFNNIINQYLIDII